MIDLVTRAVLFDMGNTLIRYDESSPEQVFQKILASLGISRSLGEIGKALMRTEKRADEINLRASFGKMECGEYWSKWDSIVLNYLDVANYETVARVVHSKWFDFVECSVYPEVEEVLLKLKQKKLKTGLISNGYEEEINSILEKAYLEKTIFDIIVGVDTTKKAKPHPEIFEYATRILKVKREETMFIGDRVDLDYKAAEAVGIHPLLIQRENTKLDNSSNLRRISSLEEIFKFID